ncbi:alpha/beta fold hydrolase [Plantactinospora soyae]|uniref:Pimeloyl-ACP methyl ester carboxylesterase n=1 Tax=Plantactinospora soyae TaxID=1544732 RepID=A0A927MF05_9ACTN|nr:alpha/beta hydrolase [Plantactinospora soyae]MBE1492552.1 pimeloyl-ACP methyl ester carboxylesterase [Plantactinospora soyae]
MPDLYARDGTRLALHDFGGSGAPVLLLPGLCGHAGEWSATVSGLTGAYHGYALDPRGHGDSERRPTDVSRDAHVADTAAALGLLGPAVVIGQSLGGHTAFLTAARHPELVTGLVLIEAGPQGPDDGTPDRIDRWLGEWPVPFPDQATAARHLGGGLVGSAWASGLRRRDDGWYPAFDRDVMVATIAAAAPRWDEFARISCPTLVVRGGAGSLDADEYARMSRHPMVTAVEIPGGGHDVHLDSPERWRKELADFLARLGSAGS